MCRARKPIQRIHLRDPVVPQRPAEPLALHMHTSRRGDHTTALTCSAFSAPAATCFGNSANLSCEVRTEGLHSVSCSGHGVCWAQGAPTPRKRSPTGPASRELRFSPWRRPPDAAWQIPPSVVRRDLLSHLCRDVCALWPRNTWAGAPTLQHPPFPKPWCEPPNRAPGVPAARTDGSILRHQCRPLSPPGCLRTRLQSHLRSPGGISGPAGHPARGTACRADLDA